MTKEELKEYIKQLKLESDLESIVFEIVDKAKEVNAALLNGIADILDLQADFYEKMADILDEEARTYDALSFEINRMDQEIKVSRLEQITQLQDEFTEALEKTLRTLEPNQQEEELKAAASPATA